VTKWIERNGEWYPSEKAADFLEETMGELKAAGWEVVGDLTMRKVGTQPLQYLLETKVQKSIGKEDIPK
jgi:hypothetical protein